MATFRATLNDGSILILQSKTMHRAALYVVRTRYQQPDDATASADRLTYDSPDDAMFTPLRYPGNGERFIPAGPAFRIVRLNDAP